MEQKDGGQQTDLPCGIQTQPGQAGLCEWVFDTAAESESYREEIDSSCSQCSVHFNWEFPIALKHFFGNIW